MARVLAGVISGTDARLRQVLEGHEVRFVRTLAEAIAALPEWRPELVIIGMRFDESRMFDLLRHIRADERYQSVRLICLRVNARVLAGLTVAGTKLACTELGADLFLDFQEFPDTPEGNAEIRRAINTLVKTS